MIHQILLPKSRSVGMRIGTNPYGWAAQSERQAYGQAEFPCQ